VMAGLWKVVVGMLALVLSVVVGVVFAQLVRVRARQQVARRMSG